MNLPPTTAQNNLQPTRARLSLLFACLVASFLIASSSANSLLAQAEPTRVTSAVVECLAVSGAGPSEATLSLAWRGEASSARLMLSLAGAEAAHSITLNGQAVAQVPVAEPDDEFAAEATGDDAPCDTGEAFYFDVPLAALANGDNRLALSSDRAGGRCRGPPPTCVSKSAAQSRTPACAPPPPALRPPPLPSPTTTTAARRRLACKRRAATRRARLRR